MINTFKSTENLNQAILAAACTAGHGNKSKLIKEILEKEPIIRAELKKINRLKRSTGVASSILGKKV